MGIFDDLNKIGKTLQDDLGKELKKEFGESVKTISGQVAGDASVTTHTHPEPDYIFTDDFYEDCTEWGLTEEDAIDVYCYGIKIDEDKLFREYNGYEIGIKYKHDSASGKPVIKEIWRTDL